MNAQDILTSPDIHGVTQAKFVKLHRWFLSQKSILVALSGGVDSSFVAAVAHMILGEKVIAVTMKSPLFPDSDRLDSIEVAHSIGMRHIMVEHNVLMDPRVVENPPDRCYYCRRELVSALKKVATTEGIQTLVDGTNADDLKSHRPGIFATHEGGVRSPLAEIGFSKTEVRTLAKALHVASSDKPSNPCLATRFPYGERITLDGLKRVAESEKSVSEITAARQVRVRDHGGIARIEVGRDERNRFFDEKVLDRVAEKLRALGFKYVTLDMEGYRSGSMDETLAQRMIPSHLFSENGSVQT